MQKLKAWYPNSTTIENVDARTAEHGWFREQLFAVESMLWGRWNYWATLCENGTIGSPEEFPIPRLEFSQLLDNSIPAQLLEKHDHEFLATRVGGAQEAKKIIFKQFETAIHIGGDNFERCIDWWLFAFGSHKVKERPKLSDKAAIAMYQLQLPRIIAHPADWGSYLIMEFACTNRAQWFPTPMSLCNLMASMTLDCHDGDTRSLTINEPCVGTGAILMPASNYSLRMCCNDIDRLMVHLCEFQAWLWIPWLVAPGEAFGIDWGDSGEEKVVTPSKFVQGSLF